jgi:peptidoglycan/xylan/chitin deacetylase (PgdA/CDA1 family)
MQNRPGRGAKIGDGEGTLDDIRAFTDLDTATAGDNGRLRASLPARVAVAVGGPKLAVHHRRRRLVAVLATLAGTALIIGVVSGAAGGSASHANDAIPVGSGFYAAIAMLGRNDAASAAAHELAAENAAVTRTLARTPVVRIAGSQHRQLALTFDDGPGPYTPEVLDVLRRMHTPATFFEVGVEEHYFHGSTTAIVALRDPVGDHTELHLPMSALSVRDQRSEILEDAAAIGRYGAPFPRLFRPPYGMWDNKTLALLRHYRMLMVLWTVDTNDYLRPGVSAIVNAAVGGARPGAIILLHDAGGDRSQTVAALPRIIRALRARGYRLVTVPKLLLDNPAPRDQDVVAARLGGG